MKQLIDTLNTSKSNCQEKFGSTPIVLENGEFAIIREKKDDKKPKKFAKKPEEIKYVLTFNEGLYGNYDINFGIFKEEIKDDNGIKKILLKDGYSVHIEEADCHATPVKGEAFIKGSLDRNAKIIDVNDYKKLCNKALEANKLIDDLSMDLENTFVAKQGEKSDFYIFDGGENMLWFAEGKMIEGDPENDIKHTVECDIAYKVFTGIGRLIVYKSFDIKSNDDYSYISKRDFNKFVEMHTAIVRAFKSIRDFALKIKK